MHYLYLWICACADLKAPSLGDFDEKNTSFITWNIPFKRRAFLNAAGGGALRFKLSVFHAVWRWEREREKKKTERFCLLMSRVYFFSRHLLELVSKTVGFVHQNWRGAVKNTVLAASGSESERAASPKSLWRHSIHRPSGGLCAFYALLMP